MKRNVILLLFVVLATSIASKAQAQNLQVLYDTNRDCITTTFEMFRPDAFGSTFLFVDMDYGTYAPAKGRAIGAYTEIAREFCFWQHSELNWLSAHAEFNGGFNTAAGSFNNAWLLGLTYSGHSADFSKTWSVTASYKAIPGTVGLNLKKQPHSFQLTGVWGISFLDGWCSFSGFADLWREPRVWQGTNFIFISEPQLWVNLNKIGGWEEINLSVGGELEISNNFVEKGFRALPALGAKWTF